MAKATLSRKKREQIRHKKEILSAALMLFSKKGFHNVSMQEIAEESEFAVGTLYKFFDSKEALFEELINNTGQQVLSEFTEILEGPENEDVKLAKFFRYQPQFQQQHGEVIKLYVCELGIKGAAITSISKKDSVRDVLVSKLTQLIKAGIDKGLFRAVDPVITARAIVSSGETLIFETADTGNAEAINMFNNLEHLFLNGLLVPRSSENE